MKKLHYIQYLHFWNGLIGLVLTCVLIGVAANIKYYVNNGAAIAGFGKRDYIEGMSELMIPSSFF
jgi:hypothetical protein